jgi:hypothetical protein
VLSNGCRIRGWRYRDSNLQFAFFGDDCSLFLGEEKLAFVEEHLDLVV